MNPAQRPPRLATKQVRKFLRHVVGRDAVPSALDFKLGGRMLLKHPGLALVGGIGMAVATAIGAGAFAFFNTYMYPDLPLHEGSASSRSSTGTRVAPSTTSASCTTS